MPRMPNRAITSAPRYQECSTQSGEAASTARKRVSSPARAVSFRLAGPGLSRLRDHFHTALATSPAPGVKRGRKRVPIRTDGRVAHHRLSGAILPQASLVNRLTLTQARSRSAMRVGWILQEAYRYTCETGTRAISSYYSIWVL